jgi:hypothetical protein
LRKHRKESSFATSDVDALVRKLHAKGMPGSVPLLVVRVRDLERIAWREGRAAARAVERASLRSFVETASRALRATDLLAHDDESEDFLAALVSPTRQTGSVATPTDCRATLARLASAMELDGGMHVETGWTILDNHTFQRSATNCGRRSRRFAVISKHCWKMTSMRRRRVAFWKSR